MTDSTGPNPTRNSCSVVFRSSGGSSPNPDPPKQNWFTKIFKKSSKKTASVQEKSEKTAQPTPLPDNQYGVIPASNPGAHNTTLPDNQYGVIPASNPNAQNGPMLVDNQKSGEKHHKKKDKSSGSKEKATKSE